MIFCKVIGYNSAPTQETKYVIRDKSNFDAELYCDELSSAITIFLSNVNELTEANFDKNFDAFTSLIQKVIDKHAPLKQLSRKQKKLKIKPWITKDVYAKIRTKRRMHKSHYINGNEAMKQEYKIFSNKVTKLKATAKKIITQTNLKKTKVIREKHGSCFGRYCPENLRNHRICLLQFA